MDWVFEVIFPIVFTVFPLLFFGVFFLVFYRMIKESKANSNAPRLTTDATVVSKREHYRRGSDSASHTTYYVTFEVPSGDRMELTLPGYEYGMLIEGDEGRLNFQGTRFISFERRF